MDEDTRELYNSMTREEKIEHYRKKQNEKQNEFKGATKEIGKELNKEFKKSGLIGTIVKIGVGLAILIGLGGGN